MYSALTQPVLLTTQFATTVSESCDTGQTSLVIFKNSCEPDPSVIFSTDIHISETVVVSKNDND